MKDDKSGSQEQVHSSERSISVASQKLAGDASWSLGYIAACQGAVGRYALDEILMVKGIWLFVASVDPAG